MNKSLLVIGTGPGEHKGQHEVTYRCLQAGDPDLIRPTLTPVPRTVIKIE